MQVRTRIRKWGNGLALRLSDSMAAIPNFNAGDPVVVEVSNEGLTVRPAKQLSTTFPYTEAELIEGLTPYTAHADEMAGHDFRETPSCLEREAVFAIDPDAAPISSEDVYRALGDWPQQSGGEGGW